tara:strand:- start:35 stop:202 length:168 start_codon:yes stop_codon:yes gene_type:complete
MPKTPVEVLEGHIEELEGLQKEYAEKAQLLAQQGEDFTILIEALKEQKQKLEPSS